MCLHGIGWRTPSLGMVGACLPAAIRAPKPSSCSGPCGAAGGTRREAEGTNKPSSLVLLRRPVSPSLVRRLRGDSGVGFSQEGSSHKTTVKHAPELRGLLEGDERSRLGEEEEEDFCAGLRQRDNSTDTNILPGEKPSELDQPQMLLCFPVPWSS